MESLKALRVAFPLLPATVFTEALGGSEQRLRDGAARLAIYTAAPTSPSDLVTEFMTRIAMWPVVATDHPLAAAPGFRSAFVFHTDDDGGSAIVYRFAHVEQIEAFRKSPDLSVVHAVRTFDLRAG